MKRCKVAIKGCKMVKKMQNRYKATYVSHEKIQNEDWEIKIDHEEKKHSDEGKRNENTRKCEIVTSIHNLLTKRWKSLQERLNRNKEIKRMVMNRHKVATKGHKMNKKSIQNGTKQQESDILHSNQSTALLQWDTKQLGYTEGCGLCVLEPDVLILCRRVGGLVHLFPQGPAVL